MQLMNPISVPAPEVHFSARNWNVGLLPGVFLSDDTFQDSVVSCSDMVPAKHAAMVPLPSVTTQEAGLLEAESFSSIRADSNLYSDARTVTTIKGSLSLFLPPSIACMLTRINVCPSYYSPFPRLFCYQISPGMCAVHEFLPRVRE
jgi:hypothetical protein